MAAPVAFIEQIEKQVDDLRASGLYDTGYRHEDFCTVLRTVAYANSDGADDTLRIAFIRVVVDLIQMQNMYLLDAGQSWDVYVNACACALANSVYPVS